MKKHFHRLVCIILCSIILFSGCTKSSDDLVNTYLDLAQSYINDSDYDAAISILEKASKASDNAEIQKLLNQALLLQAEQLKADADKTDITNNKTNSELTENDVQAQQEYSNSTPENDTDIGLRSVKVDSADIALSDDQRLVREYFDRDYLTVQFYDDLQRYPDAYNNAQVYISGIVEKMISSKDNKFELLMRTDDTTSDTENDLIYVCGAQTNVRVIQGDSICVYGRYQGIDTVSVDGTSHVVPFVKAFRTLFVEDDLELPEKFDNKDIKKIASLIFGSGIEIRYPNNANEKGLTKYLDGGWELSNPYIVELENKSNAKFDKFRFYTQLGYIDAVGAENSTIVRKVEFMQDFQHFLVISHDYSLNTGEITCYNTSLQRVWTREFENVVQIPYDYTKNNVYVATNNRIYIINAQTGEDTFTPVYVGEKTEIRKLKDGILAFSADKVDPIMLLDVDGSILWTTNIDGCLGLSGAGSVQLVDDKIITQASFIRASDHVLVISQKTGELILDCMPSLYY